MPDGEGELSVSPSNCGFPAALPALHCLRCPGPAPGAVGDPRHPSPSHTQAPSPGSRGTMEQGGQGKPAQSCRHLINGWAGGK